MTRGVILADEGFVEPQLRYPHFRLREDGIVVEFATTTGGPVRGDCGATVEPTAGTDETDFDFVVVPGAAGLDRGLHDDVRRWLRTLLDSVAVFACVGTGLAALVELDAIEDRLVTGPTGLAADVTRAGGRLTGERVTVDGPLVTGRDTDSLPFFVMAVRNALAIPQDADAAVRQRPFQERAGWAAEE